MPGAAPRMHFTTAAEQCARAWNIERMFTEASLMAEAFFAARGYIVIGRESVIRNGIALPRANMEKYLSRP